VISARVVTGTSNYVLVVRTRNLDHYSDFVINHLHRMPGVLSINSNIVLSTLKAEGSILDLADKAP
jgi:Lrp/AsnC family transcriptional regulator, leucine-responsive regulatory protein